MKLKLLWIVLAVATTTQGESLTAGTAAHFLLIVFAGIGIVMCRSLEVLT